MSEKIRQSKAFQNDLIRYNTVINQLPDGNEKNELTRLLSNLIYEVKKLDDLHSELIYNKQMPSMGKEFRDKITNTRKLLESKIKEVQHLIKNN